MRGPLKPLPAAVARWTVTARILRWLDALAAWLGVWAGAALALPSASRESLALIAALVVALGALALPLRARWRPVSGVVGLAVSRRLSAGDQAWYVRPGAPAPRAPGRRRRSPRTRGRPSLPPAARARAPTCP